MQRIVNYGMVATLFLDNFVLLRGSFDLYLYYLLFPLFLAYYLLRGGKPALNRPFLVVLVLVAGISLAKTALNEYPFFPVLKQLVAIFLSSVVYYLFIRFNDYDAERIFRVYLRVAFWVGGLGILQEILFVAGIEAVNPIYAYRVRSIMSEPAQLAIVLSPALFVSFNRWLDADSSFISKTNSIVIVLAYLLTFSGVALLGVLTAAGLIGKKYLVLTKRYLALVPLVAAVIYFVAVAAYRIPDVRTRVDDTWKVATTGSGQLQPESINLSTYVLFSNYLVAKEAFLRNPLFGTGLGTHAVSYDRYIPQLFPESRFGKSFYVSMALNRNDASSLLIRLVSETGLFGVFLFMLFLLANGLSFKANRGANYSHWLINNAVLVFFVLRLIRFGNYSALGFFLFLFLYYFTHRRAAVRPASADVPSPMPANEGIARD